MRPLKTLLRDQDGAAMVEATLVFPMLLILTFGLVEFGNALWQWNSAEKATAVAARYIATRGPALSGVPDCFVATADTAGTSCSDVAGATGWSVTCDGAGGGGCDAAVVSEAVTRMQALAPFITPANVRVDFAGTGMGFVGRGAPVPLITVRLTGMTFNFIAIDQLLPLDPIAMPGFHATIVGEDQQEGMGAS